MCIYIYIHMCIRNKLRIEPENIMIYLCVDGLKGWSSSSSSIPTIRVQKICNERGAACIKVFKVGLISIANILFHIFIHIYTWWLRLAVYTNIWNSVKLFWVFFWIFKVCPDTIEKLWMLHVCLNLLEGKSPNFGWLSIGLSSCGCRDGTLRTLSGLHAL